MCLHQSHYSKKKTLVFVFLYHFKVQRRDRDKNQVIETHEGETVKMHSFGYRANALLAFSVTALAFICAIASLSDNFSNQNPSAEIQVIKIVSFMQWICVVWKLWFLKWWVFDIVADDCRYLTSIGLRSNHMKTMR